MGKRKIEEIKEGVKKFKESVAKKFLVEKIIIFGSAARGEMTEHSDIDIIVVSRKYGRKDVFKITPKLYDAWQVSYPVDIILFNVREFKKLKRRVSIVSEALREGIAI